MPLRRLSGPRPDLSVKVDVVQNEEPLQLHFGSWGLIPSLHVNIRVAVGVHMGADVELGEEASAIVNNADTVNMGRSGE